MSEDRGQSSGFRDQCSELNGAKLRIDACAGRLRRERRSPDRRTRRNAPRHREVFRCAKTQRRDCVASGGLETAPPCAGVLSTTNVLNLAPFRSEFSVRGERAEGGGGEGIRFASEITGSFEANGRQSALPVPLPNPQASRLCHAIQPMVKSVIHCRENEWLPLTPARFSFEYAHYGKRKKTSRRG